MAGNLAGNLLRHRFSHSHFQPRNLLLKRPDAQPRLLILDALEHIRRIRWPNKSRPLDMPLQAHLATKDWPQITRTLRLRFLLQYLDQIAEPRDMWKSYWQQINHQAQS